MKGVADQLGSLSSVLLLTIPVQKKSCAIQKREASLMRGSPYGKNCACGMPLLTQDCCLKSPANREWELGLNRRKFYPTDDLKSQ